MAEELQSLIEKINRDGVEKASAEAARIVSAAKDQATAIISAAKDEAAKASAAAEAEVAMVFTAPYSASIAATASAKDAV